MAHEIDANNAFYVMKPAWHNLGTLFESETSILEAWKACGSFTYCGLPIAAYATAENGDRVYADIDSHKAIYRSDGRHISTMGKDYQLVQPLDEWLKFQPYLDTGMVRLEAGGYLFGGAKMWLLAALKDGMAEVSKCDVVKKYTLFTTSFDGSSPTKLGGTNTRVVCNNTLESALNIEGSNMYKARHTKNMHEKIDYAHAQLLKQLDQFNKDIECYKYLASKPMNDSQVTDYVTQVFAPNKKQDEDLPKKTENKIQHVINIVAQPERELVEVKQTAWSAYNGVTRYLTHEAGRTEDSRLNNLWFGSSAALSQRALALAVKY